MNTFLRVLPLLVGLLFLNGCQIAGDIFKAGVWVGVLIVLAVIGGVIWLVSRA
ncbi:MAG TPA: phosphatidate cytidylyltransferase [Candidatus Binatia bacterium]|nr:phosphatidate cytidylyltransferase [Candidatus Binatia bacterium]